MKNSIKHLLFIYAATLMVFNFSGCLGIMSQDPSKIFADGKWPAILRKLNSQLLELRDRDKIKERVEADKNRSDTLRVAVIDNGVDFTHPDLVNRMPFDIANGDITGVGYDVLGKDNTPSPQILDATLFAFGAQDVVDGKIVGPPANPLDLILKINQVFEETLSAKLKSDPLLAESYFTKTLNGSLNIVGAFKLLKTMEDEGQFSEDKDAETDKGSGSSEKLPDFYPIRPNKSPAQAQPKFKERREESRYKHYLETWVNIAKLPWVLDLDDGVPLDVSLSDIEGYDKFAKLLKETLTEVDQKTEYHTKLKKLETFMRTWQGGDFSSDKMNEKLSRALAFKKFGHSILDPLRELHTKLRTLVVTQMIRDNQSMDWSQFQLTSANVSKSLDALIDSYRQDLLNLQNNTTLSFGDKVTIRSELDALPQLMALKDWYLRDRGWENLNLESPQANSAGQSLYRRYLYRGQHPFLDSGSATTSHGTHVSGIIANQDPDIRIYPVRVLTQGITLPPTETKRVTEAFMQSFGDWLKDPLVFSAVSELVKPIGKMVGSEDIDSKQKDTFAKEVLKLWGDTIREDVESQSTNYLFVDEVIAAIKKVGEQKIRIANVSLGTEFEAPVLNPNEADPEKLFKDTYKFLLFEYFKYKIGAAMRTYANKTVFVVANGNSGKWVDGKSQSALPVDLSSPFLAKYEDKAKGQVAPNNLIDNVIGVGSLNDKGELSSFTNLLLSKRTPFVMAEGESVLSPVRQLDPSAITGIVNSYLPKLGKIGRSSMPLSVDSSQSIEEQSKAVESNIRFRGKQRVLEHLKEAITTHMVIEHTDHRALMTGTSMASPTVAGLLAKELLRQAKEKGISPEARGDRDNFDPGQFIRETLKKAEVMDGDLYIPLRRLTGEIRPDHSGKVNRLIDALKRLNQGDASGFDNKSKAQGSQCLRALNRAG